MLRQFENEKGFVTAVMPKIFHMYHFQKSYSTVLEIGLCHCGKTDCLQPLVINVRGDAGLFSCRAKSKCAQKIIKVSFGAGQK